MNVNERDSMWRKSWYLYYRADYQATVLSHLGDRWMYWDTPARLIIALTANGSAVAGWSLWNNKGVGAAVWILVAGTAAFASILHATLNTASRIKTLDQEEKTFKRLTLDLEDFRVRVSDTARYDDTAFEQEYKALLKRYVDGTVELQRDILLTGRVMKRAQIQLDSRLGVDSAQSGGPNP